MASSRTGKTRAKNRKAVTGRRTASPKRAARSARESADGGRPDPATGAAHEIAKQLLKAYGYVEVREESVLAEARNRGLVVSSLEELRAQPLEKRDALQTTFVKSAKIWATSHGTTLGSAGVMTIAADVAALVAVNLRMVQQIALSYGVTPSAERVDGWALLLTALGGSIDLAFARERSDAEAKVLATRLLEETALAFAKRLGKQAGRAMPIVGAVFGGLSNYAFTAEVGSRARAFYRELAP
jgi:hypothetical protein